MPANDNVEQVENALLKVNRLEGKALFMHKLD